ncbi:MAG: response regulator transcription factor [Chloroflexi bacterium]|nr:response regulator transcription factor [Chloroflexota bacterium]
MIGSISGKKLEKAMTTVMLVDDHRLVRDSVRTLLGSEPDFKIVGEADGGIEGLSLARRLQPDVLVLDLLMEDMNGIEVARRVRKESPETCIVMLSMYGNPAYALEALLAGARAYVLKESAPKCLVHGVREAMAGRSYFSPPLSQTAIEAYREMLDNTETPQ